jgi:hypothetical protein
MSKAVEPVGRPSSVSDHLLGLAAEDKLAEARSGSIVSPMVAISKNDVRLAHQRAHDDPLDADRPAHP